MTKLQINSSFGLPDNVNRSPQLPIPNSSISDHTHKDCSDVISPHQPPAKDVPSCTFQKGGKTIKQAFQSSWYQAYPWLHFCEDCQCFLCFYCMKAQSASALHLSKHTENTFITIGCKDWKRGDKKFAKHNSSLCHDIAKSDFMSSKPIEAALSSVAAQSQSINRQALVAILDTLNYLAGQGLAIRGHDDADSNYQQLLLLKAKDNKALDSWLSKGEGVCRYISPQAQNELMEISSRHLLESFLDPMRNSIFSVICDGTRDISGIEQESVCVRWIDEKLEPKETFIGLYDSSTGTSGKAIANIILDVLCRCNLPIRQLRGQTYDGAANMAGKYNGLKHLF